MHKRNCMARPTIPAGYEAITFVKALQTLEKLVTQNHDFDFFERKIPVQATYFGIYTYKIDSESLERIKIAMERTNNTQASQQHARTNQTTLHKQNTCKHNSSTADIASADVSASASTNLRARKRGKRAGLGGTSDTTSATLTRLFALTLLNSQNQSHRINQTKRRQER
jgi:acetyl/propionyl-CoA carboxylase alpha subunit